MNDNKLYELLREKISEALKLLQKRSVENPLLKPLVNRLENDYRELGKITPSPLISRYQVDAFINIMKHLEELTDLVKSSEVSVEEINGILRDLEKSINDYIVIARRENLKIKLMFYSPIYLSFIIYLINLVITTNPLLIIGNTIVAVLGASAIITSMIKLDYSYILVTISAIIGLFIISYTNQELTIQNIYMILVYVLIIISSITYFQLIKTTRSRKYQEKVESLLSNILDLTRKIYEGSRRVEKDKTKLELLKRKAIEKYEKLYGDNGLKLFNYKLRVLIMHGYDEEKAIKKILEDLGEK